MGLNERLAYALEDSPVRELAVYLLGNVPGLPPIVQSLHIMGIAAVMASIVMVNLKFLGLAVPSQNVSEMIGRLMPWTWWALLLNAVPGGIFVVARPARYFLNPVFGIKFSLLFPALVLAFVVHRPPREGTGLLGTVVGAPSLRSGHCGVVACALDWGGHGRAVDRVCGLSFLL